jgi:hypothetical protein
MKRMTIWILIIAQWLVAIVAVVLAELALRRRVRR